MRFAVRRFVPLVHDSAGMALDLLFPRVCVGCREARPPDGEPILLCDACREPIESHVRPYCRRCGEPDTARPPSFRDECLKCEGRRFHYQGVVALGTYATDLRRAVLRAKHPGDASLADALARLLWRHRQDEIRPLEPDLVVPVPMHWSRRFRRGANGPETIARRIAKELRAPLATRMVRRRRNTPVQISLARTNRRENVRGAFQVTARHDLVGARILLVDDVMTTGATCGEVARVLKEAGAAKVSVAIVARTPGMVST